MPLVETYNIKIKKINQQYYHKQKEDLDISKGNIEEVNKPDTSIVNITKEVDFRYKYSRYNRKSEQNLDIGIIDITKK